MEPRDAQRGAQVRARGLEKRFDQRQALAGIDLTMQPSEFVTIVGRSGSGKSTLLRILCALETPSAGELQIYAPRAQPNDAVRVVFQEPRLLPWRTALENVCVGARGARARGAGLDVLSAVGLGDRAHDYPATLSGGQKQRVALARALLHEPSLMLMDEPFGALDALTRIAAQRLVESLWRARGFSALLVTHDVEEAVLLGDRVLVFDQGRIVRELSVELPRPRARGNPELGRLAGVLLDAIFEPRGAPSAAAESAAAADPAYLVEAPLRSGAV